MTARRRKEWPAALAAAFILLASVVPVAWLEARPRAGGDVAVIFAPWTPREGAFGRVLGAGGLVVRQGIIDTILVVHGSDRALIDRLYRAGAWVVIDSVAFGGCLVTAPARAS